MTGVQTCALPIYFAKGAERYATGNYGILENDPGAQGRSTTAQLALGNPEAGGIWNAADRRGARAPSKASVGRKSKRLVTVGKDAAEPFAGLAHGHPGFVDDADPEHEAVIDAVMTTQCSGYAGGL